MRLHEVGKTDPMLQKIAVLMRLHQARGQSGLVQNLPELVLLVCVVGFCFGRCRSGSHPAQNNAQGFLQQIVQNIRQVRQRYWLAHTIRAIHTTSAASSARSACAGLSDCNSSVLAVRRFNSFTSTSPSVVFTTTRSPRRIGVPGETTMMSPSR